MTTPPTPLTGHQAQIECGPYRATIAAVGASLRSLTHKGRDLVVPFASDEIRPVYRGTILAPWPNRVVDGRYTFDGVEHQLPLTEPDRGHALHGLLVWARFAVESADASSVRLRAEVVPSDGYPWPLTVVVVYALSDAGLTTTVTATNDGHEAAPYGTAPHPYLVAGPGRVDDWTLHLPARTVLEVTADRLIPVGVRAVAADPELDFTSPRPIGSTFVDHAYSSLDRDDAGSVSVTLTTAEGSGVAMTWGAELPWVQIHTADRPDPAQHRVGLAVEPMTCPPDAFTSGVDLVRLAPGESHAASWRIHAL